MRRTRQPDQPAALMVGPYGTAAWVVVGLIAGALVASGLVQASARIEVSQGRLRAGRAEIAVEHLGEISWARGEQARAERGPLLDARAFLVIRGWVDPVLKVEITDPQDPTPYWLLSTRHPERLAAALQASRD